MAHLGLPHHAGVLFVTPSNLNPGTWDVLLFGKAAGMGSIQATLLSDQVMPGEQSNKAAQRLFDSLPVGMFPHRNLAKMPHVTFNTKHTSLRVYLVMLPRGHYCNIFNKTLGPTSPLLFLRRYPLRNVRAVVGASTCQDENGNSINVPFRTIEAVRQLANTGHFGGMA